MSVQAQFIVLLSHFYNSQLSLINNKEKVKQFEQKHVGMHNDLSFLIDSFGHL